MRYLICLVVIVSCVFGQDTLVTRSEELQIVAHRGAKHLAPENTFASARRCLELGVDYVEIDVRMSSDSIYYLMHDRRLNRTTNGRGPIRIRSSPYIDSLDAGSWFGPEYAGERVPRLDQFLDEFHGEIKVYLDLKDADLPSLIGLIYAADYQDACFFWFRRNQKIRELREHDQDLTLKVDASTPRRIKKVMTFNPQIIQCRLRALSPRFVQTCQQHGLKIMILARGTFAVRQYPAIICSSADMVNLDRADTMIYLMR